MPLTVAGWKFAGVTPFTILRSKVSVWLMAPVSRMKMTFLALFCVVTPAVVTPLWLCACRPGSSDGAGDARAQNLEELPAAHIRPAEERLVMMRMLLEKTFDSLSLVHGSPPSQ